MFEKDAGYFSSPHPQLILVSPIPTPADGAVYPLFIRQIKTVTCSRRDNDKRLISAAFFSAPDFPSQPML